MKKLTCSYPRANEGLEHLFGQFPAKKTTTICRLSFIGLRSDDASEKDVLNAKVLITFANGEKVFEKK